MTTEYIREDYPECGETREFWVAEDSGMRHTLELGLSGPGKPVVVWSSDALTSSKDWETQGFMDISPTNARQMISALERLLGESQPS
ncbi:hypothetical protein QZH56_30330 [Streptomyces olivoreticuli]|uniref:hypothetical protein n=1 Tax=Streptomyces olivoreticuli TaxID=68246 RepID=UPI002659E485|nr:hypothetical protein [Streptomyces olivoreticuli]WKK23002.1 hypothetical protein QZH56_30330 [Streptomyces olivoreticuli]